MVIYLFLLFEVMMSIFGIIILSEKKLGLNTVAWLSFIQFFSYILIVSVPFLHSISNLLTPLIIPVLVVVLYNNLGKIVQSIFVVTMPIVISMLYAHISENILMLLSGSNHVMESDVTIFAGVTLLVRILLVLLSCVFLKLIIKKFSLYPILEKSFGVLFALIPSLAIIIFAINFYLTKQENYLTNRTIISNIILFSIFAIVIFSAFIIFSRVTLRNLKLENENMLAQQLSEYTKNLEQQYDEIRKIRHDYNNILLTMSEYIEQRDMDNLAIYFSEKIAPVGQLMEKNNYQLARLSNIKVQEIKGVVANKLVQAQGLNIPLIVDILDPIDDFHMDTLKLARALAIILDNAIEATQLADAPQLDVSFVEKEREHFILVKNSFKDVAPLHEIYKQGFSTKGENRGLGLSNLKEILSECENVNHSTYIEEANNYFVQKIVIEY